tara:strand:- start:66105 stop:67295 length:1191 start_codon:yes stop_codon:yes gene_type:complete
MTKVYSKSMNLSLGSDRLIGRIEGALPGPTLIFIGGIHGNEPAGVLALKKVLDALVLKREVFKGNLYAYSGNLSALKKGVRYNKEDLNRLWTNTNIKKLEDHHNSELADERKEQKELFFTLKQILSKEIGPFYFFDLHTTSSKTIPFITVNDSLLNRKYTAQYPIPIILGIEEYLEGALLSYINELGYIAFGFEGGQHDDPEAINNHVSFIFLSLYFSGSLNSSEFEFEKHYALLSKNTRGYEDFYEIFMRYEIKPFETFKMNPGFANFQSVNKGHVLASSNNNTITAHQNARIFMPLYQGKGNDGFFLIRKVPKVFLKLSTFFRKIRFDKILPILPGVRWTSDKKDELIVNLKIARFFTKDFLHLLGYRSRKIDKNYLRVKNREAAARDSEYENL